MTWEQFKRRWLRAGLYARAWVRCKAQWEHMTLWGVANTWGIPTDAQAREWGITKADADIERRRKEAEMSKEQKQKQKKNKPQVTHYYRADWETGKVYREPDGVEVAGFDREDGEITGLFVATSSGDYDLIREAAKQVWELHRPKYSEAG